MISSGRSTRDGLGLALVVTVAIGLAVVAAMVLANPAAPRADPVAPVSVGAAKPPAAAPDQAGLQVEPASDPETAAITELAKEHGVTCTNASDVTVQQDPNKIKDIDSKIEQKAIKKGWVDEGKVYVGDAADAAQAFKADKAFGDETALWIVVAGDNPSAMELRSTKTPKSHKVWIPRNWATAC